jgi:hypothetical protein
MGPVRKMIKNNKGTDNKAKEVPGTYECEHAQVEIGKTNTVFAFFKVAISSILFQNAALAD